MVKPEAGDVFGFVPCLEHAHPLVQHVGLVERPEGDVVLATGHYLVAVQRVELARHHRVY